MWIYIVLHLMIKDVPIRCPNGLDNCGVYHARKDTAVVYRNQYCEKDEAIKDAEWYSDRAGLPLYRNYNAVKLDSVWMEKK